MSRRRDVVHVYAGTEGREPVCRGSARARCGWSRERKLPILADNAAIGPARQLNLPDAVWRLSARLLVRRGFHDSYRFFLNAAVSGEIYRVSATSVHLNDVIRLPCLVEERFRWAVETQIREPTFARNGPDPVLLFSFGACGPK